MTTAIQSCAQCRTVLLPGQSQCLVCGVDSDTLTRPCPSCGHMARWGSHFCTQCGQALRKPAPAEPEPVTEAEFVKVRNPGAKFYAGVGSTVLVFLALVSIQSFVGATFFTPQRAVTGYFDALAARDARTALSYLDPAEGVLLTDQVLKHEGYRPPENISVGKVSAEGDRRTVAVGFELDGKPHSLQVIVRRSGTRTLGLFRGWVIEDGLLPLAVSPEGLHLTVNGVASKTVGPLAVFPGQYRVGIVDNPLFQVKEAVATVAGREAVVHFSPALKDSARREIEGLVKSYVDGCARSAELKPKGCPFAVSAPTSVTRIQWTITLYPALTLFVDPVADAVQVSSGREGLAEITGISADGTAFARSDSFRVSGTAALVNGKVGFTPR